MSRFNEQIAAHNDALGVRIEDVLDVFGVSLTNFGNTLRGSCPIHGGNCRSAFSILVDTGYWRCWTHLCHDEWCSDPIGLVRGLLASQNEPSSIRDAIKWSSGFLGCEPQYIQPTENDRLTRATRVLNSRGKSEFPNIASVLSRLIIPSPYFVNRGLDPDIVAMYYGGEPKNPVKEGPLINRAILPINTDRGVPGYTCRIMGESSDDMKWYHYGFHSSHYLFGYEEAKEAIQESGTVRLVEGPLDVLACRQMGINNCVAIFGTQIKDGQQIILEQSGALDVILAQDADEPGDIGAESTRLKLARLFNMKRDRPKHKDWLETLIKG